MGTDSRILVAAVILSLLLCGCTINPQDTAPRPPPRNSSAGNASGIHGLPGAIVYATAGQGAATMAGQAPDPPSRHGRALVTGIGMVKA